MQAFKEAGSQKAAVTLTASISVAQTERNWMDWALTRQPASRHPASPPPRRYKMLTRGLVDASATVPHAGQTALIAAAKAGKVNVMRVLLDADAAVDGTDSKGYTALDNAVPQALPPLSRRRPL